MRGGWSARPGTHMLVLHPRKQVHAWQLSLHFNSIPHPLPQEVLEGRPSLLDLLTRFDSRPPLAPLLDALPALVPRLYSIANAAVAQPGKVRRSRGLQGQGILDWWVAGICVVASLAVHLGSASPVPPLHQCPQVAMALSIVRFTKACGTEHEGVATTWLERTAAPLLQGSWKGTEGPTPAVPRIPIYFRRCVVRLLSRVAGRGGLMGSTWQLTALLWMC